MCCLYPRLPQCLVCCMRHFYMYNKADDGHLLIYCRQAHDCQGLEKACCCLQRWRASWQPSWLMRRWHVSSTTLTLNFLRCGPHGGLCSSNHAPNQLGPTLFSSPGASFPPLPLPPFLFFAFCFSFGLCLIYPLPALILAPGSKAQSTLCCPPGPVRRSL